MTKAILAINKDGDPIKIAINDKDRTIVISENRMVSLLLQFTDEERLHIFSNFCKECGTMNIPCNCWNDE